MTNAALPSPSSPPDTDTEQARALAFKNEANAVLLQGDYAKVAQMSEAALAHFSESNERIGQAMALYHLGAAYRHQRNFPASLDAFQQCIALRETLGDSGETAIAINAMGLTYKHKNEFADALRCFHRSAALAKEIGNLSIEAVALGNIATIYMQIGDNATALEMLHRCLALFEEMADEHKIAIALHNIGVNYMTLHDTRAAIPFLERGLPLLEKLGDRYHIASLVDVLGTAHVRLDEFETGFAYIQRSLQIFEELGMSALIAMSMSRLGGVQVKMGRLDDAKQMMEQAIAINGKEGNRIHYCENLGRLGTLYADPAFSEHDNDRAIQLLLEARSIGEEVDGGLRPLPPIYSELANVYERQGKIQEALACHRLLYQAEKRLFNEESDERVRNLQVRFDLTQAQQAAEIARRDAEIAQLRTVQLAEALAEAERLRAIADQRAATDGLTGVSNRRYLDEKLTEEWQRSHVSAHPLSLALIDIDHFKKINDRFGHDIGDETLRRVAHLLQKECRSTQDTLGRYGGEEFALLLPATDTTAARVLCERIRLRIASANWEEVAAGLQVTISLGIGCTSSMANTPISEPTALLKLADQKLYTSKTEGRNRVSA